MIRWSSQLACHYIKRCEQEIGERLEESLEKELEELEAKKVRLMIKMCLRVVGPMSKVPLEHPRILRTGSRSANEIKKIGRK